MVLTFAVLSSLAKGGLGGMQGNGHQRVSWIHMDDFLSAVEFLIAHEELSGPVNVCAPGPLSNRDFMRVLRQAWDMPVGLPAMQWMLEIGAVFLRTETELILKSRWVVPKRLLDAGFAFAYPAWAPAAEDLVSRAKALAN